MTSARHAQRRAPALMSISERRAISLGVLGVAIVAGVDAMLGYEINLVALQMVPVLLVTWYASPRWGLFILGLTLMTALTTIYLAPPVSKPLYRYLDLGSDFIALGVLILVQARLREMYLRVRRQSHTDGLTHCLNRSGFHEQLQAEVARQKRYGRSFALLYLDLDDFKAVNDSQGHQAGDVLLQEVGRVLRARLRNTDSAGRLGGDEFAVLLRETTLETATYAATQLKQELERVARGHRWPIGFSIGAVWFSRPPQDADEALRRADTLMYEVKKAGKNALHTSVY